MDVFGAMMRNTSWRTPTKRTLKARIFTGPDTGYKTQVFPPGEVVQVPSEFDSALQKVRHGRVVGGLAPQLVREGEKPIPVDPAIDAEASAEKAREFETQKAIAAKAAADLAVEKATEAEAKALASSEAKPAEDNKGRGNQRK